jgi:hypothetical protein
MESSQDVANRLYRCVPISLESPSWSEKKDSNIVKSNIDSSNDDEHRSEDYSTEVISRIHVEDCLRGRQNTWDVHLAKCLCGCRRCLQALGIIHNGTTHIHAEPYLYQFFLRVSSGGY